MGKVVSMAKHSASKLVTQNPWHELKGFTSARIALGRSGNSVPTKELLSFQLDHAQAMDAVHCALDVDSLVELIAQSNSVIQHTSQAPIKAHSKATDRFMYLQRPDLGRELNDVCWNQLQAVLHSESPPFDLAIVVADGLSSIAIQNHANPVIEHLLSLLGEDEVPWHVAPITVVRQGRVAIGDDVCECLQAKMVVVLIGERPGLTSPDSMGMYLTWQARRGAKDSDRNCISNIRPQGLAYEDACKRAVYLLKEARRLELSGVNLKDRSSIEEEGGEQLEDKHTGNFLIG
ncbi:ethanolamine ammonia-lyase subunit EutC [Vibrio crassostreae]|jgi:ethanolamine ammonia-lyase small subunit|uniref:ethanolamine ammonia-lyase subunit EutC n=1 Tax=Vibrio crassostreae TaxID=246167 RepID=UPI0002D6A615|nr:ethanolamine ammonia-lyase subunit EutC [Vibrio crassostreae]OEE87174.1 ethanolamine ammonia-lyase [Vibrio crassostreae 9ZC88]